MRLHLDVPQMRACMDLWRDALALPVDAGAKEQAQVLARVAATVSGWSDLLHLCRAQARDEHVLSELSAEVHRFRRWIKDAVLACNLAEQAMELESPLAAPASQRSRKSRKRAERP